MSESNRNVRNSLECIVYYCSWTPVCQTATSSWYVQVLLILEYVCSTPDKCSTLLLLVLDVRTCAVFFILRRAPVDPVFHTSTVLCTVVRTI
jgi:hypothetical protein